LINIGCGEDVTIKELAELIGEVIGYTGNIVLDRSKPDGTPQKLLDITRISHLGWQPRVSLRAGIKLAYAAYLKRSA
jgi:GDP-L-fucose synthase